MFGHRVRIAIVGIWITHGLTACGQSHVNTQQQPSFGLLVVGPIAAVRFGFASGDTLQEVPVLRTEKPVQDSAKVRAGMLGYDPACSRYFVRSPRYLVLLVADCEHDNVEDGVSLAAFDENGRMISWPTPSVTEMEITLLQPARRAKQ